MCKGRRYKNNFGGVLFTRAFLLPFGNIQTLIPSSITPLLAQRKSLLLLSVPQPVNTAPALPSPRQRLKLSGLCRASRGRDEPPFFWSPFSRYQPCQLEAEPAGKSPLAFAGEVKGEGSDSPHHTGAGILASPLLFPSFPLPRLGMIFKIVSRGGGNN